MSTNTRGNTPANRFRRTLAVFVLAMAAMALLAACGDDEGQARQDQQIADLEAQVGKFDSQVMELETNLESARMEAGKFESQVMELETALEAARTEATASLTPLLAMLSQPPPAGRAAPSGRRAGPQSRARDLQLPRSAEERVWERLVLRLRPGARPVVQALSAGRRRGAGGAAPRQSG